MDIELISLAPLQEIKIQNSMTTTTTTIPSPSLCEWQGTSGVTAATVQDFSATKQQQSHNFAIVCLVCRHRFGDRCFLSHPTNTKMHKLICPSCIKGKALRRLYREPGYKAAIMAMHERERKKKQQQLLQTAVVVVTATAPPAAQVVVPVATPTAQ